MSQTDDAFAMGYERLASAIAKMALSQPGTPREIDTIDYYADSAWELLRTDLDLPFSHPVSAALYEFVAAVTSMNVTFEGRGKRVAFVSDGTLGRALAEVKAAAALTPEYATVMIADAAAPFSDLALRYRFA